MNILSLESPASASAIIRATGQNVNWLSGFGGTARPALTGADIAYARDIVLPVISDELVFDTSTAETTTLSDPTYTPITVTGTLTSDGSTPVAFEEMAYVETLNAKPSYGNLAGDVATWHDNYWDMACNDGGTWTSTDDVATPDLCTTWTPASAATGTPVVSGTPVIIPSVSGIDGADHEGNPILISSIRSLYIACTAGAAVFTGGDASIPIPEGSDIDIRYLTGDTEYSGEITLAATAAGTVLRLEVIGEE
jgi:hypothetical protein